MADIYLDHHATTPLDPRVLAAMLPWLTEFVGNPASASHRAGDRAQHAVETARAEIAEALGCEPREVVFTSGATESNNLALQGLFPSSEKNHSQLLVGAAEHRSVLDVARKLQRQGVSLQLLPVDRLGRVPAPTVSAALSQSSTARTRLVSVQWANHEVGTVNDISEIAAICQRYGVLLHVDAVQAVGKIPVNLRDVPISLLSLSAHKLYGPQGIGALIVRREQPDRDWPTARLTPLWAGGGQEGGLRSGTLPVALIVGFAAALRWASSEMSLETAQLTALRQRLFAGLQAQGVVLNGPNWTSDTVTRLPGNLSLSVTDCAGMALWAKLKQTALAVSAGAACRSAVPEPSSVLRAMGSPDSLSLSTLRFGIGRFNTPQEIDTAIVLVSEAIRTVRETTQHSKASCVESSRGQN